MVLPVKNTSRNILFPIVFLTEGILRKKLIGNNRSGGHNEWLKSGQVLKPVKPPVRTAAEIFFFSKAGWMLLMTFLGYMLL